MKIRSFFFGSLFDFQEFALSQGPLKRHCPGYSANRLALSVGLAAAGIFTHSAQAAALAWDAGGAGTNLNWTNSLNWNPDDADVTADSLTFGATGTAATGTMTNTVDASASINSLTFTNTGGTATMHTTQITGGQTLTIAGTTGSVFNQTVSGGNISNVAITGATAGVGTLEITGATGDFRVAGITATTATAGTSILDLSGLGIFTASVANFKISDASPASGTSLAQTGTLTLANSNTITATLLSVGTTNTANTSLTGGAGTLNLGQSNTLNANTINIGGGKSSGTVQFLSGSSTATVTIRGTAGGTSTANLNLGLNNMSTGGAIAGTVDFGSSTLDAKFGTMTLGLGATGTATGTGTGTLTFGAGTLTATTVNVGNGSNATNSANPAEVGTGVINMNGGTFTATDVTLGRQNTAGTTIRARANGTFNQNAGTAEITTLTLGDRTGVTAASAAANVTGVYNLTDGTLKAATIQAGGSGNGVDVNTRTFNWAGGTIQNLNSTTDLTIGAGPSYVLGTTGTNNQTFNVDSGRTITVNGTLGGGGGFSKSGTGTLTLGGASTYLGLTTVGNGTLLVNAANNGGGGYTVDASGTLGGTGSVGASTINVSGVLSPGASVETFASGTLNFATGSTFAGEVNSAAAAAAGADLQIVSGGLNLTGVVNLTLADVGAVPVAFTPGTVFSLLNYSGAWNGGFFTFAGSTLTDDTPFFDGLNTWQIDYNAADGGTNFTGEYLGGSDSFVNITAVPAVPEPASILLGGLGLLALLRRRRN